MSSLKASRTPTECAQRGLFELLIIKVLTQFPLNAPVLLRVQVARRVIAAAATAISLVLPALFKLVGRVEKVALMRIDLRPGWSEFTHLSRFSIIDCSEHTYRLGCRTAVSR